MGRSKAERPAWVRAMGIGVEFAGVVGIFAWIGWAIDRRYDSAPWALVIAVALGLIGGTYNLIKESMAAFQPPPKKKDDPNRPLEP